ncbi:hypothetical protein Tco_0203678, partial [Tanacetum coccineum]
MAYSVKSIRGTGIQQIHMAYSNQLDTTYLSSDTTINAIFSFLNDEETEEDDNPNETDNVPEIFKIEGNLFNFETHLCKAFNEFNYLLKSDIDLFTYDIKNFKTYDEYERELNNDMARGAEEPWLCNGGELLGMVRVRSMTYFQDHKWYDELADGKLKDETLALKAKVEGSWGDATPGVMKFYAWLKNSFENFH